MRAFTLLSAAAFAALCWLSPVAYAADEAAPAAGTEVTVYTSDMGLVKDTRNMDLQAGLSEILFSDVAAAIDPTSVHFKSLTAPNACVVREQNFQYDLVNRARLLEKYLGKTITIRNERQGGGVTTITGTLLSASDQLVIQTDKGLVITNADSIELPQLPAGLMVKPTLNWLLQCDQPGGHLVEVSYITSAMGWQCDYVAVVNQADDRADLNGWVTINNNSGATYNDARLKLIAGDVRRVQEQPVVRREVMMAMAGRMADAEQFEEKTFFEYHMYTLDRRTTLRDRETKQVELLTAAGVPVQKLFFFDGQRQARGEEDKGNAEVKLEIVNARENGLGMPLPKGKVRVYKADDEGSLQFVGEDLIDHTPKDEKVRLTLGEAFDVVGEWHQTNVRRLADNLVETTVEVKLRNHKTTDVEVVCVEHSYGDWEITQETQGHTKRDATTFEYKVPVPHDGEATLIYTVRVRT